MMGWGRRVDANHGRKKWKLDMHAGKCAGLKMARWYKI